MKKILIPMVAVAFLAACSDEDTNFAAPPSTNATVSSSSEAQLPPTDLSSSSVLPVGDLSSSSVVLPELSSSSVEALPGVSSSSVDALPGVSSSSNGASQFTYVVPKLTALDPTKKYSFYGAELTGLDQFKYGRFEARMKMAALSGTVSSMFVYYDNSTTASESKPLHEFGFDATQDFHLYAIVWTPEYVSWEIDSVEVRRDTLGMSRGTHADADQVKFLTKEQSLRFNLWASKSSAWTGKWDGGVGLPVEQQIDYVRVYSYDEATKGFTMLWQDDFDGEDLNYDHWSRGNWEMERVNLREDNVIVENGVCRLIMDYEAE